MIAAPDGRVWVTPLGGPALGAGGTGDVLAGMLGAAIASSDDVPLDVARAVWWHAAAGERAGADRADRATATDLLAVLPAVLGDLAPEGGRDRRSPRPVDALPSTLRPTRIEVLPAPSATTSPASGRRPAARRSAPS
jgi:hypothetical protein